MTARCHLCMLWLVFLRMCRISTACQRVFLVSYTQFLECMFACRCCALLECSRTCVCEHMSCSKAYVCLSLRRRVALQAHCHLQAAPEIPSAPCRHWTSETPQVKSARPRPLEWTGSCNCFGLCNCFGRPHARRATLPSGCKVAEVNCNAQLMR